MRDDGTPDSLGFRCQEWFLFTVFVCQHMETEQTIPERDNSFVVSDRLK
jgi:hypothetical protein